MRQRPQLIRKKDGTTQPFDQNKFIHSLERTGLSTDTASQIAKDVLIHFGSDTSTRDLKRKTHSVLYKRHPEAAGRYRLKDALMKLGPTGFPFEHIMAQLFQKKGFKTRVGIHLMGLCISHEVDVLAQTTDSAWLMECKYHNQPHVKSDVKVPLYVKSRFDDLVHHFAGIELVFSVACNTRFTDDAVSYSRCAGIQLLSWNYPETNGLNHQLDHYKIYPISILHGLNRSEINALFEQHIYTLQDLLQEFDQLKKIITDPTRRNKIIHESEALCR